MKSLSKIALALTCLVTLTSVASVSASFIYSSTPPADVSNSVGFTTNVFDWEGSEVLPDDVQGENHQLLIDLILNSDAGLNTQNSYLNKQIKDRQNSFWSWDTYGSMDVYDAQEMASIFQTETHDLDFLLEFPDNEPNTQYLYTTSVELGESSFWTGNNLIPTNRRVYAVYRTILKKDTATGQWYAEKSELGSAQSDFYDNNALGSWVAKCPSFDPDTWTSGKQGTGTSNSIYSYVGLTTTAYVDSVDEATYYDLTVTNTTTRTVTTTNTDCTITILDKSGNEIATNMTENGWTSTVSWKPSFGRNETEKTYYIVLKGARSMTFTIA